MTVLLDTHAFLWYLMADARLSATAKAIIANAGNQLLLSKASLWEIAIKVSVGKLTLPAPFCILIPQSTKQMGIQFKDIEFEHIALVSSLPFHNKDPFDRILVATCLIDQVPLLSADAVFDKYSVQRQW